ncbi:ALP1-like protein [Tanacetum coccineum]|uniref:ALP1-like protein n=1 Tax=Tanacetum coccineum TaxID=301880 RepID=A0ABQ4XTI7_9ASTR
MQWMFRLTIMENDVVCISELRMDRATFRVLCQMVSEIGGLQPTRNTSIEEVLKAILKLHHVLLKKPEPISQDCQDERWKCFQGCLGALDGTLIKVTPPSDEKSQYRTRKGCISTNVLGVCCPNMQFIYVLPGWEGSAHDGRVLRDAISRPQGLRVPHGCYYLVDAGYCNANGFLAPYRGQRYHLKEFDGHRPETAQEYFN